MTELTNILEPEDLALPQQKGTVPLLSLVTMPFILGVVAVSPLDNWNIVVKILGSLLAIAFFVRSLSSSLRLSTEFFLYMSWVIWTLTGVVVARSQVVFWTILLTIVQITIMMFIIVGATYLRKTLTMNLLAFLAGTAVVAIYSLVTGEYDRPEEQLGGRVAGLALNANAFGFLMVCATIVLAYLWMLPYRHAWLWRLPLAAAMVGAAIPTVLSGSRDALLSLLVFYFFWFFFCYRSVAFRPKVFAAVVLAVIAGAIVFLHVFVGSVAQDRIESAITIFRGGGGNEGSLFLRFHFYWEALAMLAASPVIGVGLAQFMFHSGESLVAHSEYAEVFADTGVVGGLLYFSIFVVLWIRAGKIAKYTDDLSQFRIARLVRAILVVIVVSDVGRWNYNDKITWVIFASFIGYTNAVWQELSQRLRAGQVGQLKF